MAESQIMCMEDGQIKEKVPESKPEFYYSEEQRAALEQLLRNGDGAFKTRLKEDNVKDFLSAREIKSLQNSFTQYRSETDTDTESTSNSGAAGSKADSGVHSTYWPEMSDNEVPPLDIGWPNGGFFKGVTRVEVHTHPPKDNGPHIKEVVRKLIQEATKVLAVVMDMLTDLQILQDLLDATTRRSVPVYILLDAAALPHFLDMCQRLKVGVHHLRNLRTRTLEGTGLGLSFGRLPGSLCSRYMLVDGDTVMFGSYNFSWSTSRIDRNLITVMTGHVVDVFDRDFRELYAMSSELDLYKEFHLNPPPSLTQPVRPKTGPKTEVKAEVKRLPATTSRFQVSLGDTRGGLQVPAHKYYNPKYSLVFGDGAGLPGSSPGSSPGLSGRGRAAVAPEEPGRSSQGSERLDTLSPLPSDAASRKPAGGKHRPSLRKLFRRRSSGKNSVAEGDSAASSPATSPTATTAPTATTSPTSPTARGLEELGDSFEVDVKTQPSKWGRKPSKLGRKSVSQPTINTMDTQSE
ncbi:protein FAM83F [Aplochiton taeniatus]